MSVVLAVRHVLLLYRVYFIRCLIRVLKWEDEKLTRNTLRKPTTLNLYAYCIVYLQLFALILIQYGYKLWIGNYNRLIRILFFIIIVYNINGKYFFDDFLSLLHIMGLVWMTSYIKSHLEIYWHWKGKKS